MINFIAEWLKLKNFMSFGNNVTEIYFDKYETICVEGINLDQPGSNGSGKTTIINALCYVFFNKPFQNISLQRLINNTNASKDTIMEVSAGFIKNDVSYQITRTRGAIQSIEILKNGVDITPGKGVIECDKLIVEILGISYEMFVRTFIFSGATESFLNLPIAHQRSFIEELFNITILSKKAAALKKLIKETETGIAVQTAIILQQEQAKKLHDKQKEEAKKRITLWDTTKQQNINKLNEDIVLINGIDFEEHEQLFYKIKELNASILEIESNARTHTQNVILTQNDLKKSKQEYSKLSSNLCPYCEQSYSSIEKKINLSNQIEELELSLVGLLEKKSLIELLIRDQKLKKTALEKELIIDNESSLKRLKESSINVTAKLEQVINSTNPHIEAFNDLNNTYIVIDSEKLDQLKNDLEHQNFLYKLLTHKDSFIRREIINNNMPFLNERINHYSRQLGLPHIAKFDSDMSCTVTEYGRQFDYGNLSGGEQKRIDTALALSFRDVLHHLHFKTNLMFVDELDGQLDVNGIDCIVRLLKQKSRDEETMIFIVSHHPSILGRLHSTMTVTKQFGFSQITK